MSGPLWDRWPQTLAEWRAAAEDRARRDLAATRFHEAGHAIVGGRRLGLGVRVVSVEPGLRSWGHIRWGSSLTNEEIDRAAIMFGLAVPARLRDKIERHLIGTLAGPEAELRARAEGIVAPEPELRDERERQVDARARVMEQVSMDAAAEEAGVPRGLSDFEYVQMVMERVCPTPLEAECYERWLRARARGLVYEEGVWRGVVRLAAALQAEPTLRGTRLRQVMDEPYRPRSSAVAGFTGYVG